MFVIKSLKNMLFRIRRRVAVEEEMEINSSKTKQQLHLETVLRNAEDSVLKDVLPIYPANDCCKQSYEEIVNVNVIDIAVETQENRQKWFKERQFRITGSRCYEIFTYSLQDWEMKAKKYFWPKMFNSKYTDHGRKFEAAARNAYIASQGVEVMETGLIINKQHPWIAYTPDGVVIQDQKAIKLIEIKCPYEGKNYCSDCKNFKLIFYIIYRKK